MKTKAAAFQDKSNFDVGGGNYYYGKGEKRTKLDFFVKTRMTCTLVWTLDLRAKALDLNGAPRVKNSKV